MSNETLEAADKELEELRQQIEQKVEEAKEQAANPVEPAEPSPASAVNETSAPVESQPAPVTPNQSEADSHTTEKPKDDPMEWAKKKGFKTPEDMARALLQKEQEFHQSRQKAEKEAPPPSNNWQPRPDMTHQPMPGYGYPPPPVDPLRQLAAAYPNVNPDDIRNFMPVIVDAAEAISFRRTMGLERELNEIKRSTSRNNELMTLMQDPAFRDSRVQKEVHAVLDSDPSIFQRERTPYAFAYEKALANMTRKTLQQGQDAGQDPAVINKPPVTAGGGNGSAFTVPIKITEKIFDSWSDSEQKAFLNSNGRIVPKR